MKVGIIGNASGEIYREAALAFGHIFDNVFTCNENLIAEDLHTCDMFVVIGNYFVNYHTQRAGPVKKFVADSGKPFIVVTGSLFNTKNPNKYVRLNVNGFCNNFAMMPCSNPNRFEKIKKHLGITEIGKHKKGDKIVVAPNALASPMMFGKDVDHWLYLLVDELLQVTDRPIQLRYHRKKIIDHSKWHNKMMDKFGGKIDIYIDQKSDNGPIEEAHCAITYNSTFSVMSLLSGTANVTRHEGNFVHDITKHELNEDSFNYFPSYDQIQDHYGKLANMEWFVDEIKDGSAWKVLGPMVEENVRLNRNWL